MSKITVVGCGAMGGSLCRAFLRAGHELTVVDRNKAATDALVGMGATCQPSLDEALDCDFILLSLPDHMIAENVISSCKPEGLKGKIIVNATGITPKDTKTFEQITKSIGAIYVDQAIICYPQDIGQSSAYIVYAGPKDAFLEIEDALKAMSNEPQYLGEDVQLSEIIDLSVVGIQYGLYWFTLLGAALCMRSDMSISDYCKHIDPAVTALFNGMLKQLPIELNNYTGKFQTADVASLEIQTHGLQTVMSAFADKNVDTSVCKTMEEQMLSAIKAGYGQCNFEAAITQMLK